MTLGMLAEIAGQENWETETIINTFKRPLQIKDFVDRTRNADLVGISMMTFEILRVHKIIKALKQAGKFVIVGGAHPTDEPEECIEAGADVNARNDIGSTPIDLAWLNPGNSVEELLRQHGAKE